MTKKLTAIAALVLLLLSHRPRAQGGPGQAQIYFVDVGTGASTLIVSPTGKTLLVDGGPPGSGTKIQALLDTLGIATIDYTVITHYHIDHMGGMIQVLNAGRVAGVAYDNGDGADVQPPGTSTSPTSTRGTYLNYIAATGHPGVTRQTAVPGTFIDLGGGMRATFVAAGGHLASGGSVAITTEDLNSESISTLIEYNNFDYLVSGDLTGGGSTSTAKTPDVETYVAQMVGDVDVVQLDHHGSTTANNQSFLSALKAEVAFAQTGETNTFGHPNRETVNKYLNTPGTAGATFTGTGVPPTPGTGPIFYQNEASPAGDDRVTQQGYTGAAAGNAGQGTVLLATDGTSTYSLGSFDDGGTRLNPALHTYAVDGVSNGLAADFKPTVIVGTAPVLPLATDNVTVSAAVNDRESPISSVTLAFGVNGVAQAPIAMSLSGGVYQATIPSQPDGTRVDYAVTATAGGQTTTFSLGYFSGLTTIASIRLLNGNGEPLYTGYAARILGTVTASGFSPGTNDDYVQDATGAVNVYRSTDTPTVFTPTTPGQSAEVRGRIGFLGGRLRLDVTESVEKTSSPYGINASPGPAPAPVTTTIAAISSSPESFEGQFVSIANVSIVSGSIPSTPQPLDAFVTVTDGTGMFLLKVDHDTDIEGFGPAATFTAVGIIQQDDFLRPFDNGYNLAPRSRVDLGAAAPAPAPLLTIADARVDQINNADGTTGADFVPDRLNQVVIVQGAVSSIDFRGGNGIEYYIQDGVAGIDLFSTSLNAGPFAIGDTVEATGAVTHFNGLTELTVTSVTFLSNGSAPAAQTVTLAQLGDGGAGEAFEGRLVRIDKVLVTGGSFPAAASSGNVTITDATGTATLRVDSDTDIDGTPTPTTAFSVTGLVGQFASTPFDSGYQLLPRSRDDIESLSCSAITIGGTLAGGTVAVPYSQTLTASGGTGPYAFSIAAGAPPAGLSLSAGGILSGTPSLSGTFAFTVRAVAADGCLGVAPYTVTIVNPAPVLSVSPATLAFGTVAVGASGLLPVTLTNTGSATLNVNTVAISGADASQFQVAAPTPLTLAPNASATATVTFVPTTGGGKSATLTISSNGGIATIALTGTGAAPTGGGGVVVSEFRTRGPAASGNGSGNDEFVEIYNNSDTPIDISGYRLVGSNNAAGGTTTPRATVLAGVVLPARAHYLFVNTTATTGYSLPVPGNRGFTTGITDDGGIAIFDPTGTTPLDAVGMHTGSAFKEGTILTPLAGAANESYQRRAGGLAGTLQDTGDNFADFQLLNGVAPNLPNPQNIVLTSAPASIDFGGVMPPDTRSQTLTIKNLLLTSVTLNVPAVVSGADASSFSVGSPSTTTLAAAGTATIAVTFQPSATGAKSASVAISSSSDGSATIALSGTGLPGISVSPASFDFGSVESGSTASATFVIANGNPTDVTLTPPFAITGADAAVFSVTTPASTTLAPGGDTTTTVTFQPTSLGSKSATLVVTSTNGGTRSIPLSGLSACPAITVAGTLPNGEFGALYSQALSASGGGGGPFTFAIASGGLPGGMMLDPNGTVSGTPGALGVFTFTAEATAPNGCTGSAPFTLTVADTHAPVLSLPANITTEATGATTVVNFAASATDAADASPVVSCTPASGFAFAVTTTTVSCTATDAHGNSASGSFTVTVTDHTPPALTLPANLTATAVTPAGVMVTFPVSAFDLVDGTRAVTCTPASGSTFAIGTTTVACSASDAHANQQTGSFTVTVTAADVAGRMVGAGTIENGTVKHEFAFLVQERATGADAGAIRYQVRTSKRGRDQEDRFDAVRITTVAFFNVPSVSPGPKPPSGVDTVTFTGTGAWNGRSGYSFEAVAVDAGEPGRGRDRFAITVRDAGGHIVAAVNAPISGGNIESLRIR